MELKEANKELRKNRFDQILLSKRIEELERELNSTINRLANLRGRENDLIEIINDKRL